VLTDNRHRTAGELRFLFERYGGNLGATGCVAFMFTQKGVIVIPADAVSEERIMELALEAGADDVSVSETIYEVTTDTQAFEGVKRAIGEAGIAIVSADLSMVAGTSVSLELGIARRVVKLLDALEDHDDVDAIYSNTDFSDEVVAALSKEA
jgi:transcriptional/translational regulatory protein YebC/TACO1